jgi:hypothetical protein
MRLGFRLLLLVALLLPFRGAMAVAGVLCHGGGTLPATAATAHHHEGGHEHAGTSGAHGHDAPAPTDGQAASGHGHAHGSASIADAPSGGDASCPFCSAVCGAPPLPATGSIVPAPLPAGAERFPALASPRPTGAFPALDRPPRNA